MLCRRTLPILYRYMADNYVLKKTYNKEVNAEENIYYKLFTTNGKNNLKNVAYRSRQAIH